MKLEEIPVGVKITINVSNGGDKQIRFTSRVVQARKYLLAIPFMHKGIRVNFEGEQVKINMEVPDAMGVIWTFKGCKVDLTRKDGLLYHRIKAGPMEGIANRRSEYRTYVWQPAIFNVEGVIDPIYATLKDISPSGFAFVVDPRKKVNIQTGKSVACVITEKDGKSIHIRGKVIRREKTDQYLTFGCSSNEKNPEALEYIRRLVARVNIEELENDNGGV